MNTLPFLPARLGQVIFCALFSLLFGHSALHAQDKKAGTDTFGSYHPNAGFRIVNTPEGAVNFKIFSYLRYLNQQPLDEQYVNAFGDTTTIDRRQDLQVNKVNLQFLGWFLDPRFRYLFYVWTNNTAQGQTAQVVVAGNLSYELNKYFTFVGGIISLPGVRSTEGSFPFWNTVDNRLIADEFFRPSYTTGVMVRGNATDRLNYMVMIGNNLSQLGIDAGQLDDGFNSFSAALVWHPTTGEYGLNNNFGDFENHQNVATRLAGHYSHSKEDKQGVPTSEAFENVAIRLSDGSVIFAPNLFGPGIQVEKATYQMISFDAGAKYKGLALEGEFYWRQVDNLNGKGLDMIERNEFLDNGLQLQASAMIFPQSLQLYTTWSQVYGEYGDPSDVRVGLNWYPKKTHSLRWNFEYLHVNNSPVGGLSLPMPVGGNGGIFYSNLMVNF
ncbi:MAG: hypothetical protein SFV52_02250 [Saprospiraceae bacterium]|nr:hypothetical protein [Saprospiraceae bacterium]